jgi:hypothetical protein
MVDPTRSQPPMGDAHVWRWLSGRGLVNAAIAREHGEADSRGGKGVSAPVRSFTLFFEGPDLLDDERMDALFEAGCDDAVFGERDGAQYAAFDRDAPSLCAALASALDQLTSAVPGLEVTRVEPDHLVTMAAIADRVGLSREQIRLLSNGRRGPGGFPSPVAYVDRKTRLWNWSEVSRWFQDNHGTGVETAEGADLVGALNAALALRSHVAHLRDNESRALVARVVDDGRQAAQRTTA